MKFTNVRFQGFDFTTNYASHKKNKQTNSRSGRIEEKISKPERLELDLRNLNKKLPQNTEN